jgi:molecular chaperone DnaK
VSSEPLYAGFDLGTSNSVAAVYRGGDLKVIRNAAGELLTPSVVRIDARGRVTVGSKARSQLERDPENTHREFKRLMGTRSELSFARAGLVKRPEELAGLILASMRDDVRDAIGVAPERAVISVPALFELPQSAATSEAARLAGFERVELLQEPVASALAAGWSAEETPAPWMVYDLGGGTFDVSLLETRDGLLRVVGHDGDNFLGGRDFDMVVVEWLLAELRAQGGPAIDRANPAHAAAIRVLRLAAEQAKIELSRASRVSLSLEEPLEVDGAELEVDVTLERETLERLAGPLVERSLEVCGRLLARAGLGAGELARVILVGGPSAMPFLRRRVAEALGAPIAEGHDPMTLVAEGAALYAATAGLDARPAATALAVVAHTARRLWLQVPPVSADLTPHVMGRVVDGPGATPARLRLTRVSDGWAGGDVEVDPDGTFVTMVSLEARRPNAFAIEAWDGAGAPVAVHPDRFTIVQGLSLGDPPLSRSVGVALADNIVCVYFERGAPLPARRTYTLNAVETVPRGSAGSVLRIPIVQGEFDRADLNRLVGALLISGHEVGDTVPVGAAIEVTLELDRGGRLTSLARIEGLDQVFEGVAQLAVPDETPDSLERSLAVVRQRIAELDPRRWERHAMGVVVPMLLGEVESGLAAARGGDADAAQKTRRLLLELDGIVAEAEMADRWPELEARTHRRIAGAALWVSEQGTPPEQQIYRTASAAAERALVARDAAELDRQLLLVGRIADACYWRDDQAWVSAFERAAADVASASDLPRAGQLVDEGKAALAARNTEGIRAATRGLWKLLPPDARERKKSFDSGVR